MTTLPESVVSPVGTIGIVVAVCACTTSRLPAASATATPPIARSLPSCLRTIHTPVFSPSLGSLAALWRSGLSPAIYVRHRSADLRGTQWQGGVKRQDWRERYT